MDKLQPVGELILRTEAMPANTNSNGDIFGGWLVSQMDLSAGVIARSRAKGRVATVAIDSMTFIRPVQIGHVVGCYGKLLHVGRSSMKIQIQAWIQEFTPAAIPEQVTQGVFTFVAIDEQNRPRAVDAGAA